MKAYLWPSPLPTVSEQPIIFMFTKKELKSVFSKYNFSPLKRLGENYLIDRNIKDKIIASVSPKSTDHILEIGPGAGALTLDLASTGAMVLAIEKDRQAFKILSDFINEKYPNLNLLNQDILKFDLGAAAFSKFDNINPSTSFGIDPELYRRVKAVGSLPYYITTPIIEYLLKYRRFIRSAYILVQKEVALRFLAEPGSKDYGSITCFIKYYTRPSLSFTVKRSSFYPEPKVDSSFLKLDILKEPSIKVRDEDLLFKIIRGAFNQRRKTIINSLSRPQVLDMPKDRLSKLLGDIGIDPNIRPERLSLEEFGAIVNLFYVTK